MSDIILEKASFTYDDERHHGNKGRGVPAVVAHTYTHTAAPEKKIVINPAPL